MNWINQSYCNLAIIPIRWHSCNRTKCAPLLLQATQTSHPAYNHSFPVIPLKFHHVALLRMFMFGVFGELQNLCNNDGTSGTLCHFWLVVYLLEPDCCCLTLESKWTSSKSHYMLLIILEVALKIRCFNKPTIIYSKQVVRIMFTYFSIVFHTRNLMLTQLPGLSTTSLTDHSLCVWRVVCLKGGQQHRSATGDCTLTFSFHSVHFQ